MGTLMRTLDPRRCRMLAVSVGKRTWVLMISSGRKSEWLAVPCASCGGSVNAVSVTPSRGNDPIALYTQQLVRTHAERPAGRALDHVPTVLGVERRQIRRRGTRHISATALRKPLQNLALAQRQARRFLLGIQRHDHVLELVAPERRIAVPLPQAAPYREKLLYAVHSNVLR